MVRTVVMRALHLSQTMNDWAYPSDIREVGAFEHRADRLLSTWSAIGNRIRLSNESAFQLMVLCSVDY